jgi:hypothetical protein
MLIAQQQQEQNEIPLENQRVIDNINAAQSQDSSDNGVSSSSKSDNSETSDNEQKNIFADKMDKNLGADSRFILMSQDGKIDLFSIESNERELDVSVLPRLIHPIESFDSTAEALSWINDYDNRSSN